MNSRAEKQLPPTRPAGPTRRSTRDRILEAAISLFVDQSIDGATTREIAALAGVAEGTLYRHFKSKDEIAASAFFTVHQKLGELVEAAGTSGSTLTEKAESVVFSICRFADAEAAQFKFHLLYTHHFLKDGSDGNDPVSATEHLIRGLQALNMVSEQDDKLLAAMALGPVLQTALHVTYGRLPGPMTAYQNELANSVVAILKTDPSNAKK